ncbi:MAG: HAD-IC family P-type ATPase [Acidimicrobiia bacterium]|nr:HAD-IC family P-type ATPase [Acidimicrobiia bacterium]
MGDTSTATSSARLGGLTKAEVRDRKARGLINDVPAAPSRSVADIFRSNIVTRFNLLLGALLVVILFVAPINDALFGIVLVGNTTIGIIQELRAKRTLDRLNLLNAPQATVVRDGKVRQIPIDQVVLDDVLQVAPGDQLVVDGEVLSSAGLEINEALLTGESDPVVKAPGAIALSGSFVAAGIGRYQATRVGREAYASRLADEARRFTLVRSELREGIDWILLAISWIILPAMALLVWSQLRTTDGIREALAAAVAGGVGMVPQGLVLLTSIAFAVGVIRLGRKSVLVQELPAVEGLARVDVICFDKTGTLTEGRLAVQSTISLGEAVDPGPALASIAAADPSPNATMLAVNEAFGTGSEWTADDVVPFSSERKWAAASFGGYGTWVLGAPEILLPGNGEVAAIAEDEAAQGHRVLALAHTTAQLRGDELPPALVPTALVTLGDVVRADAAETLRYFAEQGVQAKVISGDHPETVGAIARTVGVPGSANAIDARELPNDPERLARYMDEYTVFGRVAPHQKREMVKALQSKGHVVAMTGDGVNDVLALKDSDIGIAVGSGSPASRAVAQLVLMDGRFDTLPGVVSEGRRVIANIERVANLFVTKTIYALALVIIIGALARPFPFLPRHLTLVGSITIGIPAFLLALEPNRTRARPGFIKRVLRFSLPAGLAAAAATFAIYEMAIAEGVPLVEARTAATLVLTAIGLFALAIVARPLTLAHKWLIGLMAFSLFLVISTNTGRDFFELKFPELVIVLAGVGIVAITGLAMYGTLRSVGWMRNVPDLIRSTPVRPRRARSWSEFNDQWEMFRSSRSWSEYRKRRRGEE